MSTAQPNNPEPDPRVRLAAERTLLAWVRTGLAMMGFGFVVARFGLFLRELAATTNNSRPASSGPSLAIGTALVLFGVAVNLLASREHLRFLRFLERGEPYRPAHWPLAVLVSIALAAVGLVMTGYLLFLGV